MQTYELVTSDHGEKIVAEFTTPSLDHLVSMTVHGRTWPGDRVKEIIARLDAEGFDPPDGRCLSYHACCELERIYGVRGE